MTRKKIKKTKEKDFYKEILSILEKNNNQSFNWKQIAAKLHLTSTQDKNALIKSIEKLRSKNKIQQVEKGKYKAITSVYYYKGILQINVNGGGFVFCEDLEDDVFVSQELLNRALHGDLVEVYVFARRRNGKIEGEITKVLERKRTSFVGIVQMQKNFAFVIPTDRRMYTDIFVSKNDINSAQDGDKVLVKIKEWQKGSKSPFGMVEKVLGRPGEHHTEIHSILAEYGLPSEFPFEVEEFAKNLDLSISEEEISKRKDFRNVLTFTIDPKDAKDFDDALSFQILENGNFEIGVHIADVSHYVQEGTILDEEAYNRATSIYLVDRVVPMLPEILSNFACSLRPNEEKYAFSAVFEMNKKAEIVHSWFGRTIINSDERFSYEEAQFVIENLVEIERLGDKKIKIPEEISIREGAYEISAEIVNAILSLDKLAKILREKRMKNGAISFDKLEVKFHLDENNNPLGVYTKESKDANHLIEEFMLLANRKVAEFVSKQHKTFVYRIHDEPDEEKLMQMQGIISRFGYQLNLRDKKSISHSINNLLEEVKGKKEQNLVDTLAVRSMSKAKYSTENVGHYGLAFDDYTHFTSPIRRYPDVMVHRLLQFYLDGNASANASSFEEKCKHSSQMENLATSAERDSIKYMQIKYMQEHQNQNFIGVISGVTEWGIYVEIIENKCEGMIRIRDLKDDFYVFDETQYALVGEVTKNRYQLGDEVVIRVKNTDLIKKHLDFELVGKN